MARTRVKTEAVPVPASEAEARALLAEIGRLDAEVDEIEEALNRDVQILKDEAEELTDDLNARVTAKFRALHAYVEAHREDVIPKKRKSATWPEGTVGFRDTPWSVRVQKAAEPDILRDLEEAGFRHCVRVERSPDKNALLAERPAIEALKLHGLAFTRKTEFFAKPRAIDVEHVEKVKAPAISKTRTKEKPDVAD